MWEIKHSHGQKDGRNVHMALPEGCLRFAYMYYAINTSLSC